MKNLFRNSVWSVVIALLCFFKVQAQHQNNHNFSPLAYAEIVEQLPSVTTLHNANIDYCSWEQLSNTLKYRVESQTAFVNGKLYVISGFGFDIKILSSTTEYDPSTDEWTEKAPIPIPVTHVGAVVVGDEIWVAGGFEGDNPGVAIDDVQIYNTKTNEWRFGPSLPAKRASAAMAVMGRKLHFIGGLKPDRQTDVSEHYVLDLDNQSKGWYEAAALPEARNHLSAATVGGKIYAIGGQRGHDVSIENTDLLHAYDPVTDSWERKADLTFPRSHFEPATFVLDGDIYIVGGRTEFQFFRHITKYSPEENKWTELCGLTDRLLAPAARVINDYLYITHGGNANVRNPTNEVRRRPIERNFSPAMGFLNQQIDVSLNSGSQTTIKDALWVKSGSPTYQLSFSGNPSWITAGGYYNKTSHEGDQIEININTSGLSAGTYSTVLKANANGYQTAELPITVRVSGAHAAHSIFLNAGGESVQMEGNEYLADSQFPSYYNSEHTYSNNALNNILYRTERGSTNDKGSLTYSIPVENGEYTVRTHHAELYYGYIRSNGEGKRVFDISIEGELLKEDVDLFKEGVGNGFQSEAKVFTFEDVEVEDGHLTIQLQASVNRPTISAIEIISNEPATTEVWLEAEDALVGSNWIIEEDDEASGEAYVTIKPGLNSHSSAPEGSSNHVSFNFVLSKAGEYQIKARVKASNSSNDSFWFKVNNGDWVEWWENVQTYDFAWKELANNPFNLSQGNNTITFAYREDGAQLDQLHIYNDGDNTAPPLPQTSFWLEAECATIGSNWRVREDDEASGEEYLTIREGLNSHSNAPIGAANHLVFNFNLSNADSYKIFARVKASSSADDSFWFKVNNGTWIEWAENVKSYDFDWKEVANNPFSLNEGNNTITFAYREDGAQLDKLFVTNQGNVPEGMGGRDIYCDDDDEEEEDDRIAKVMIKSAEAESTNKELVDTPSAQSLLNVYPNPASNEINIRCGESDLDKNGRFCLFNIQGEKVMSAKIEQTETAVSLARLASGIYIFQYVDDKKILTQKIQVSK
ncbi:malectin domain-containing carbohydrate-binding protein [Porifericola rhodea]|uniref:Kelch repeat-containing protein n=1 Tax=Porifericola rhodea TaxID=930972 RepID=UPI002665B5EB|nr:malectin domain-containing carbohydrate-binding protein [Porifericola rhodea]WKN33205.1 malectin domain-containing carbohydrate-binding protein [Porifericola rhodea]